jgi:hypothetical protein
MRKMTGLAAPATGNVTVASSSNWALRSSSTVARATSTVRQPLATMRAWPTTTCRVERKRGQYPFLSAQYTGHVLSNKKGTDPFFHEVSSLNCRCNLTRSSIQLLFQHNHVLLLRVICTFQGIKSERRFWTEDIDAQRSLNQSSLLRAGSFFDLGLNGS